MTLQRLTILGSTGSIGTQALQVVDALKGIKQRVPHEYDPSIFSKLILVFLENELI